MTDKVKGAAVYDDLVSAPDDKIAEIVEGNLYVSPRPSIRHSNAATALSAGLFEVFGRGRKPGGWRILVEPELHLFDDVLVPDIAGWKLERFEELTDGVGVSVAPDWICEILSPSTRLFDRQQKLPRYAAAEVHHVWLVDPPTRTLQVLARNAYEWIVVEEYSNNALVSAPPFEESLIDLATLWT